MAMPGIFAKFPKAPRAMNFEMRSPTAPTHALSRLVNEFFFSLSLSFFSITRPPMRHLRGHVAITQPATWQLGQERGLIAEHEPVFASVFSLASKEFLRWT